jgi:hypothetical protein
MQCQKCGRVVRPNNCRGRDESLTERRYYCSCGFVNKTYEQVVMTWRKTEYKPRVVVPTPAPAEPMPLTARKKRRKKDVPDAVAAL